MMQGPLRRALAFSWRLRAAGPDVAVLWRGWLLALAESVRYKTAAYPFGSASSLIVV